MKLKHIPALMALIGLCSCNFINFFTVSEDIELGGRVAGQIASDSETFPILPEWRYPEAYDYVEGIRNDILASGEVGYDDRFEWQLTIIHDDSVLNAFVLPGGYIYLYTGLFRFLDSEDALAGILGHEMAHAAERHATEALSRDFGVSLLFEIVLGEDYAFLADIAWTFGQLAFSRDHESDADMLSVRYLAETEYNCAGVADFFQKLIDEDEVSGWPEFLSTHPNSGDRVADIRQEAEFLGCPTTPSDNDYQAFIALLPETS